MNLKNHKTKALPWLIAGTALLTLSVAPTAFSDPRSNWQGTDGRSYVPPSERREHLEREHRQQQERMRSQPAESLTDALRRQANIDVPGMVFGDLVEQLAPHGWNIEFRGVPQTRLLKKVDMTITGTRGQALRMLLDSQNLTVHFFESGFERPLMIISKR